jgi:uncharacterized protein (DUF2236 family)
MGVDGGLFGPGTVTWRVTRESVLLVGGGRALLMQVAHPLVAAAVAQHSSFQRDPWRRLYRTLDLATTIVFGDGEQSARASAALAAVHARVQGTVSDGRAYRALDPDLLLWVWATLVDTTLVTYARCVAPLEGAERERYYAEQTRFAVACGVPPGHWPPTVAAFAAYVQATIDGACLVGDDARRIARTVVRPAYAPINLLTVGLLPPTLRERYGFTWGPLRERSLRLALDTARTVRPALPARVREFPRAYAATHR